MYALRQWSVNNARPLRTFYDGIERVLVKLHPVLGWLGYRRLDKAFLGVEKVSKGLLFDSQSCGQCILGSTGMACPMNCPKLMRNGPCGGVRANGKCEVDEEVDCIWNLIVERADARGRLESLSKLKKTKNWSNSRHGGPKRVIREDLRQ